MDTGKILTFGHTKLMKNRQVQICAFQHINDIVLGIIAEIITDETGPSLFFEYGLDTTWIAGYDDPKVIAEDSLLDLRTGNVRFENIRQFSPLPHSCSHT